MALFLFPNFVFGFSSLWLPELGHSHDLITLLSELLALSQLGPEISMHELGWAPLHTHVTTLDPVGDKEIANVDVLSPLAAGALTILLQRIALLLS